MDRWMVLRKQMPARTPQPIPPNLREPHAAPAPGLDHHPYAESRARRGDLDWLRGAVWMLAGYLLLRLLEGGVRGSRAGTTRRTARA